MPPLDIEQQGPGLGSSLQLPCPVAPDARQRQRAYVPARPTVLLLIALLALAPWRAGSQSDAWRSRQYILPILRAGPNNQLRHLRFMLAVAKQLNRTLILTGIMKHYTDRGTRYSLPKPHRPGPPLDAVGPGGGQPLGRCFRDDPPYHIEFSEILDRQYLEAFTPVTTSEELKAQGWDGVIDGLVYPNASYPLDKVLPYLTMTLAAAKVAMYHDLGVATTPSVLHCDPAAIQGVEHTIRRWRVVAMMFVVLGNAEVVSLTAEGLTPPASPCWADLFHANRRLKANAWLQGIARQYVREHVSHGHYLAMHVRPQADPCLKLWVMRNFDLTALSKRGVCWAGHNLLHTVVGPKAAATMAKHNITDMIVLTHPHLQPVVTEMLAKVGLTARFIDPGKVARIAGCHDTSSTFMMLVEMQVAVQSTVFLGTASSSITETVLYERLAVGNVANVYLDRPFPRMAPLTNPQQQSAPLPAKGGGRISGLQAVDDLPLVGHDGTQAAGTPPGSLRAGALAPPPSGAGAVT